MVERIIVKLGREPHEMGADGFSFRFVRNGAVGNLHPIPRVRFRVLFFAAAPDVCVGGCDSSAIVADTHCSGFFSLAKFGAGAAFSGLISVLGLGASELLLN